MWNWRLGWVLRYQSTALIQSPYSNNQLNPELLRTTQTKWSYVPGVNPMAVDLNRGCMQIEPMGLQGRFRPGITHHKTAGSAV